MVWLTVIALLAWGFLLLFRGGFWRADQRLPAGRVPAADAPEVVAVIPARDEAETIAEVMRAHAASDYPGRLSVVLVDDGSSDGTARIAAEATRDARRTIRIVGGKALPEGWSGKLWALDQGVRAADDMAPGARWLLLTDADIVHRPDTLSRLVAHGEEHGLAMVSLMARLDCRGVWGRLLIPAFVFFFQKLYPFPMVNDPRSPVAGAAGGCVLIRRDALAAIGGIAAIRAALIDDCALARAVKTGPPRRAIWLGLSQGEVVSRRDNRRLASIWAMVTRTAFVQLGRRWTVLALSTLGMAAIYLAPPVAVLGTPWHGNAVALATGLAAWGMAAAAYAPTVAYHGLPRAMALSLPVAALLYMMMTLDSARRELLGRGGAWKGRTYAKRRGTGPDGPPQDTPGDAKDDAG